MKGSGRMRSSWTTRRRRGSSTTRRGIEVRPDSDKADISPKVGKVGAESQDLTKVTKVYN